MIVRSASMRPRIVVTHPIHTDVAARLAQVGEVDINPSSEPWSPTELSARLKAAEAMIGFMTDRVDAALLAAAPRLKVVACALKGYDGYDADACTAAGVWLTIVPDLLTAPTAELALGLAIALGRHVRSGDAHVRSGAHRGWRTQFYGHGLDGAVVGIVGMGQVGRAIAARLRGFGCRRLLGVDVAPFTVPGVEPAGLAEALAESDTLFLAVPLTRTSRHMIDGAALMHCKRGQLMINVGRGSVVDEAAIARALESGELGGYATDVFEFEDWSVPDRPVGVTPALLQAPNTLFTPHLGSAVRDVRRAIEHRAADNVLAVLAGERPPDAVNLPRERSEA